MNRGTIAKKNVTGVQTESPDQHATFHTIACEGAGVATVTVRPFSMTNDQSIDNGSIVIGSDGPVTVVGHFKDIIITPVNLADVFSFSITSSD